MELLFVIIQLILIVRLILKIMRMVIRRGKRKREKRVIVDLKSSAVIKTEKAWKSRS